MAKGPSEREIRIYWSRTSQLMRTILVLWLFFGFLVHMAAPGLNQVHLPIFRFPLGFYMAAQGSLIAFVFLCFWNARAQNQIDEDFNVSEE